MYKNLNDNINQLKGIVETLPIAPGIYKMLGGGGEVLYVGKAKNLKNRVRSYTEISRLSNRLQRMMAHFVDLDFMQTETETEALLLEQNLIKKYKPPFNILLKDDKSFAFIELSDHPFPAMKKFRGKQVDKAHYFGPFTSAKTLHQMLLALQKIFLIRNCSESYFKARTRPCLLYQIKQCSAPCVRKVSEEAYRGQVEECVDFLSGKGKTIQKKLEAQMEMASEKAAFEKAAYYRDRLKGITMLHAHQEIYLSGVGEADFITLYKEEEKPAIEVSFFRGSMHFGAEFYFPSHAKDASRNEIMKAFLEQFYTRHERPATLYLSDTLDKSVLFKKVKIEVPKRGLKRQFIESALKRLKIKITQDNFLYLKKQDYLKRMKEVFDLPKIPERIEIYDNSHLFGSHAYGGMVVANVRGFIKQAYRRFKFAKDDLESGDDYAMMYRVFKRRFKRAETLPDIILIDGGKGQLNKAYEALQTLKLQDKIHLIAIAKGEDRYAGEETFYQIGKERLVFEKKDPLLYYLQTLRDEAHRYVIGTHRLGRKKTLMTSRLDAIPSIGAARKKALIRYFGSSRAVENASLEALVKVVGISKKLAKQIYEFCAS